MENLFKANNIIIKLQMLTKGQSIQFLMGWLNGQMDRLPVGLYHMPAFIKNKYLYNELSWWKSHIVIIMSAMCRAAQIGLKTAKKLKDCTVSVFPYPV